MSRRLLDRLLVALVLALVAVGLLAAGQLRGPSSAPAVAGDPVELSGEGVFAHASVVRTPSRLVTIGVADPVTSVPGETVRQAPFDSYEPGEEPPEVLAAPDGGRVVPVDLEVRPLRSPAGSEPAMAVRLVADGEAVEVWSSAGGETDPEEAFFSTVVAIPVSGAVALADLAVEVEYDGLVQTLDVASGEVDAGVAEALYAPRSLPSSCSSVSPACDAVAATAGQDLRPIYQKATASDLYLYPWDGELGWAEDGTLWATATVQTFSGAGVGRDGRTYVAPLREPPADVELDGLAPVVNDLASRDRGQSGRVVFSVAADADPQTLVVRQVVRLRGTAQRMATQAEITFGDPVDPQD